MTKKREKWKTVKDDGERVKAIDRVFFSNPEVIMLCFLHVCTILLELAARQAAHTGRESLAKWIFMAKKKIDDVDLRLLDEKTKEAEKKESGQPSPEQSEISL